MGWVSGIVASELTRAGLHVVGLERGHARGTQDFQNLHDELLYALQYELMQDTSQETWTLRHDLRETALPFRTLGSFLPGQGLGGAGVHWNGTTYRFHPRDFQIRSHTIQRYGAASIPSDVTSQDWGITYDQLEPYYDRFEKMAGISGKAGHLNGKLVAGGNPFEGNRRSEYPTPPMKISQSMTMFRDAANKIGWHAFPMPSANLPQQYTNPDGITRAACTYCGFCEKFGCEVGAKADPTVTVIPVALKTGKLEIRYGANVFRIDHDGKRASGVRYYDPSGNEHVQPANMVLVASFVFNNARLLLQSNLGRPYQPGNGGVVGRNYAYQVSAGAQGYFYDKDFKPYMSSGSCGVAVDDWNADNFDHHGLGFIGGGVIQCNPTGGRPIEQGTTVPKGTPKWGAAWKAALKKSYGHVMQIGMQGEVIANRNHFLDLDPTYKDQYGNPLLRITFDWTPNEHKMVGFMANKFHQVLAAAGAKDISVTKDLEPHYDTVRYQSTHVTGGTIMGSDPHTSVVNHYLQMWDADNVFVCGASNFPQNAGMNPTGTVGALAYRCAEGMKKYHAKPGALA
ncbi:MAG: GMC family oxidoreductase [Candidatus Eremiobacteraeota bacterium]|nr:GMC family oxidoreductase [Candidatus Eremiobacteraeota bacterium]